MNQERMRGGEYTGIIFPGAILSHGGFSGGKFYAGGKSMLQHRISEFYIWYEIWIITETAAEIFHKPRSVHNPTEDDTHRDEF